MTYYPFTYFRSSLDDDGVLTVAFDRPDRRNAITPEMHEEIAPLFSRIARDRAVRAVVLTGSGTKAFCVGASLPPVRDARTRTMPREAVALSNTWENSSTSMRSTRSVRER